MPPTICTSKWRMPSTRFEASRTVANASGRMSSSVSGLRRELLVGKRLELRLQLVDLPHGAAHRGDVPVVGGTKNTLRERVNPSIGHPC